MFLFCFLNVLKGAVLLVFKIIKFKCFWKEIKFSLCKIVIHCSPLKPCIEKHLSAGVPPVPGPGVAHPQSPRAPLPGGPPHLQACILQRPGPAGEAAATAGLGCVAHPVHTRVLVQRSGPERRRFSEGGMVGPW